MAALSVSDTSVLLGPSPRLPFEVSSSSSSEQAPWFHVFPDLPVELRLEIWSLVAKQPREVIIDADQIAYDDPVYSKSLNACLRIVLPNPAILFVNRESRQVRMEVYKQWSLGKFEKQHNSRERVFVNPAVDSVILRMDVGTQIKYDRIFYLNDVSAVLGIPNMTVARLFPLKPLLDSEVSFPWPKDSAIFSVAFDQRDINWYKGVLVITADEEEADDTIKNKRVNVAVQVMQRLGMKSYSPGKEGDFKGAWTEFWRQFAHVLS